MLNKKNSDSLVSFLLLTYNQEDYINKAIQGALIQDYSNLEIIISDDCSSDDTFNRINQSLVGYVGKHTVFVNRCENNMGLIDHINFCITNLCKGEIIVMAAGDDLSLKNRVSKSVEIFNVYPNVYSVSLAYRHMDQNGSHLDSYSKKYSERFGLQNFIEGLVFPILGCTRAYRKEVFTEFDSLSSNSGVEDSNFVFRALLLGDIIHRNEVAVYYRIGINSLSSKLDPELLYRILKQRLVDSKYALDSGIISLNDFQSISNRCSELKTKVSNIKLMINTKYRILGYFKFILFRNEFHVNEKLNYLKNALKHDFRR